MKYLVLFALILAPMTAHAVKFPTVTISADGVAAIATLPQAGGMWEGTVIVSGTFGSGTVTLGHSTTAACSTVNSIKDITGTAYSTTSADTVNVRLGIDKNNPTYLCATVTGSTSPTIALNVYDRQ